MNDIIIYVAIYLIIMIILRPFIFSFVATRSRKRTMSILNDIQLTNDQATVLYCIEAYGRLTAKEIHERAIPLTSASEARAIISILVIRKYLTKNGDTYQLHNG